MSRTAQKLHPGINLGHTDPEAHEKAEEKIFGFWIFLMSDAIIFGLLFATYAVMMNRTAGGPTGVELFDLKSAFIQTMLLLTSTLTMGFASLAMKYGHSRAKLNFWLVVTLSLGIAFLAFEMKDFATMFGENAGPWRSGFLSGFFALVPTHGLHVTFASIWLIVMLFQFRRYGTTDFVKIRLMRLSLFWHFLDIVWIGIFSVVYLQALA